MARAVKLNHLDEVFATLDYPVALDDAVDACDDVTLVLADGEENLGDLLERSSSNRFESMDEIQNEVLNLLPQHAVGEPYQSEGEG